MSITDSQRVVCVCGAPVEVALADSINAVRHPHLRELVLARKLHRFGCGGCGRDLVFEKALSYVDWDRRQLIQVASRQERHREAALVAETRELYERVFRVGPAAVQALRGTFFVRLCFGYEELREKLVVADAGLNDLILEQAKCEVLAAEASLRESGVLTLHLDAVKPDGALLLVAQRLARNEGTAGAPGPDAIVIQRALYDDLAGRYDEVLARRPRLASGPHVSLLRLLDWPAPAPAAPPPVRRTLL